jgi:hypothetical protein
LRVAGSSTGFHLDILSYLNFCQPLTLPPTGCNRLQFEYIYAQTAW